MIGAIEILIILIIFGIIYGKDAIDRTYKKHPNESMGESLTVDFKEFYKENPRRLFYIILWVTGILAVIVMGIYQLVTRPDIRRMIGIE